MTNELLQLTPGHERATGNKIYYEKELERQATDKSDKKLRGDDGSVELSDESKSEHHGYTGAYTTAERQLYESLCRNELEPDLQLQAKLKCRYVTNKSAFLKIAPLKLEEVNLKPYIVIYHDVIHDNEIEVLKQLAKPRVSKSPLYILWQSSELNISLTVSTSHCAKS